MPKDDIRIGNLSGVARPSPELRKRMGQLYGMRKAVEIDKMLDDYVGVDALARLLTEAMETCQTADGRVDMMDVAAFVMRHMREHQK